MSRTTPPATVSGPANGSQSAASFDLAYLMCCPAPGREGRYSHSFCQWPLTLVCPGAQRDGHVEVWRRGRSAPPENTPAPQIREDHPNERDR